MSTSNFLTVTGTDSVTTVPISVATDANGDTAVTHCATISIAGTATSINESQSMPIAGIRLALPAGAATDASMAGVASMMGKISSSIAVDQAQPAQGATLVNRMTASKVSCAFLGGSKNLIPVAARVHRIVGAFVADNDDATTATATYANIK